MSEQAAVMDNEFLAIAPCRHGSMLLHGLKELRFLKIDVEGAELDVIAGGAETLRKLRQHDMHPKGTFHSRAFV